MTTTDALSFVVMAVLIVLSALTVLGIGSLAIDGIRLFRRWRSLR